MNNNSANQRYTMLKKYHTDTLNKAIIEKKVDEVLVPFLLEVVKIPDIFTSSSCAGRIMLLSTNEDESKKISSFHKKFHRLVSFEELKKSINEITENDLWLKVESFIFHFGCSDYEKAKQILSFSQEFGLKKAGIITAKDGKYILEITSTQFMALPIKVDDKILISDDYLKLILERANKKMKINFERLSRFSKSFLNKFK
jgi:tRNA wybutosine-synthesizing protein 3